MCRVRAARTNGRNARRQRGCHRRAQIGRERFRETCRESCRENEAAQTIFCVALYTRMSIFPILAPENSPRKARSEEHTSELQSLMRISYAVFCLKKKNKTITKKPPRQTHTDKKDDNKKQDTMEQ